MRHRSNYTRNPKPIHGFTLIELLVVISIISLLLSIMMPSLSRARDAGRSVVCKSNLKTMGLAEFLFVQENGGKIASGRLDTGSGASYSVIYFAAQLWSTFEKTPIPSLNDFRAPAYNSPKWLNCPSEKELTWSDVPLYRGSTFPHYWLKNIGYARNGYNNNIGTPGKPEGRYDRIDSPGRQANIIDGLREWHPGGNWCDLYWPLSSDEINPLIRDGGWRTALYRHTGNKGINVLFWDGHVETAQRSISDKFLISVRAFR